MNEMVKKERFWNDLDRNMDRVRNGYRLWVLGDLNGCIGDRMRADIGNTKFKHKSGKGPRWSRGKEHDRSGADEEGYAAFVQDVREVRGM